MSLHIEASPLERADGSISYSCCGYSIIAAVHGPIEVQRRDELAEAAVIEVVVRPAIGIGGVRERYLESIIHKTLRYIILVKAHPRKLIQVTLQIMRTPINDSMPDKRPQSASNIEVLPSLLQASMLAILSTSIPLATMITSTTIALDTGGNIILDPSPLHLQEAASTHVLAFSTNGRLIVAESEGQFDMDSWEIIVQEAHRICGGEINEDSDTDMRTESDNQNRLTSYMKSAVEAEIVASHQWKP